GLRAVCAAAPARPFPRGAPERTRAGRGRTADAGADAHRLVAAADAGADGRHRPAAPRRARAMAAGARPGWHHPARAVRKRAAAHPGGGGVPAVPRGCAGPGRLRGAGRTARAIARAAQAQRGRYLYPCRRKPMTPRLPCLALLALALAACKPQPETVAPEVDEPAPATQPASAGAVEQTPDIPGLRVQRLYGKAYDLAVHRGQWVRVNCWATWCGPGLQEMPELSALHPMRGNTDVVGLAYEDIEPADMQAFLDKHPV